MKGKLTINLKDITKILSDKIHSTIFYLFVTDNGHTELMLRNNTICQYWPQTLLQCNVLQRCRSGLFKRPFGQIWSLFSIFS